MAGYIPKPFIEDVLARTDIVEVIAAHVPLKNAGSNHIACCPFHNEKTPSFTVSSSKQFYHCFGCGAHGNAINFLMEFDNLSFTEAVAGLAQSLGMQVPYEKGAAKNQDRIVTLHALLAEVKHYYCQQLQHHAKANDYLQSRGLSTQTIANFEIGYAPPGWDKLLSRFGNNDQRRQLLHTAGLVIQKDSGRGYYDRFRDRIQFPIHNRRGQVVGFGGRVLGAEDQPKYLNSPETPVFHKGRELYGLYQARQQQRRLEQLCVVEGYMDVIGLAQHGIQHAVATLGTAINREHLQILFKNAPEVVFCFDGDGAGRQAAWRALEIALPELDDRHAVKFLLLPDGEDPDSLIKQHGKDDFQRRLDQAMPLSEYFIETLVQRFDCQSIDGRAQLAEFARPLFEQISAPVFRNLLREELARTVGLSAEQLLPVMDAKKTRAVTERQHKQRRLGLEINDIRTSIEALLAQPALAQQCENLEALRSLKKPGIELLLELLEQIRQQPELTTATLLERYRDTEMAPVLAKLAAHEFPNPENDPQLHAKLFHDAVTQLTRKAAKQRYTELLHKAPHLTPEERQELQSFGR